MNGVSVNVPALRSAEPSVTYRNITMFSKSNINDVVLQNTTLHNESSQWNSPYVSAHLMFGFILCVLFVIGFIENVTVLFVYCKTNHIRNAINTYIIGLIIGDMGQLLLNIPLAIVANIHGSWLFGDAACQYYGFIVTSLGISQIALLTVISLERYLIFTKHAQTHNRSVSEAILSVILCYAYGSLCAIGPVLGWSRYEVELYGTTCSIIWGNRSGSGVSYAICLFTFGLFVPLVLMIWSYTNIAYKIYSRKSTISNSTVVKKVARRKSKELRVTLTILIMIGSFLMSWLPYAVVSFYTLIHVTDGIPHGLFIVPPIIAKSSIIWNPLIYVLRNREFRKSLLKTLRTCFCHGNCNRMSEQYVNYTNTPSTNRGTKQQSSDNRVLLLNKSTTGATGDNDELGDLCGVSDHQVLAAWRENGDEHQLKQESSSADLSSSPSSSNL